MFPLRIEIFPSFDEAQFPRYMVAEDRRPAAPVFSMQAAFLSVLPLDALRLLEGISYSACTSTRGDGSAAGENFTAGSCTSEREYRCPLEHVRRSRPARHEIIKDQS